MTVTHTLKKIVPLSLWEFVRKHRYEWWDEVRFVGQKWGHMRYAGRTLYFSKGMSIINRVRGGKIFEPALVAAISQDLEKEAKPVFCDVGANVGLVSLAVLERVPSLRVFCFEPGPHQSSLLAKTVARNNLISQVTLETRALGKRSGERSFVTHARRDVAKDGFLDTGRAADPKVISVPVTTLSSWWESAGEPRVSVVKMDTEGSELEILEGGTVLFQKCKPTIYLEIEALNLSAYGVVPENIATWCEAHNYRLETLDGEVVMKGTLWEHMKKNDTFCARPKES